MKRKKKNLRIIISLSIVLLLIVAVFISAIFFIKKEILPPRISLIDTSAEKTFTATKSGEKDQGTFKIIFEGISFIEDLRIDNSCKIDGLDSPGQGIEYTIGDAEVISCELSSDTTNDKDTLYTFELEKGKPRTFTLTVVATASESNTGSGISLKLNSINYGRETDDTNDNYYVIGGKK